MTDQFATIHDYETIVHSEVPTTEKKTQYRRYQLEFLRRKAGQQHDMFRVENRKGPGPEDLVIRHDGSVRARRSNLFGTFPVTLRRDDARLIDAEGIWLRDSDFGSLLTRLDATCARATKCQIQDVDDATLKAIREAQKKDFRAVKAGLKHELWDRETAAYQAEISWVDEQSRQVVQQLLVSQRTWMPLRYRLIRDGKVVQTLTFDRYRSNLGKGQDRFSF